MSSTASSPSNRLVLPMACRSLSNLTHGYLGLIELVSSYYYFNDAISYRRYRLASTIDLSSKLMLAMTRGSCAM